MSVPRILHRVQNFGILLDQLISISLNSVVNCRSAMRQCVRRTSHVSYLVHRQAIQKYRGNRKLTFSIMLKSKTLIDNNLGLYRLCHLILGFTVLSLPRWAYIMQVHSHCGDHSLVVHLDCRTLCPKNLEHNTTSHIIHVNGNSNPSSSTKHFNLPFSMDQYPWMALHARNARYIRRLLFLLRVIVKLSL